MSGVLLVTGSISPTMVLKRTMASNKLTPEQNMTEIRSEIISGRRSADQCQCGGAPTT